METLDKAIEEFNPKKAEIVSIVEKYKDLTIEKNGLKAVRSARMELRDIRIDVTKQGKTLREEANNFRNAVIERVKEFVGITEPLENELHEQEKQDKEKKLMEERRELLPERIEKLKTVDVLIGDEDELLAMDDIEFDRYYNDCRELYLGQKAQEAEDKRLAEEKKIQDERDDVAKERAKVEEDKRVEAAKKEAEKEAQEKAILDAKIKADKVKQDIINASAKAEQDKINAANKAKQDKIDAIELEKQKAANEKQRLIDEQKEKEELRLVEEKRIQDEKDAEKKRITDEAKAEVEQKRIEAEKLAKEKSYQDFLKKYGCTGPHDVDFHMVEYKSSITLYKKVGTYNK